MFHSGEPNSLGIRDFLKYFVMTFAAELYI
jgi:hypothetical protein